LGIVATLRRFGVAVQLGALAAAEAPGSHHSVKDRGSEPERADEPKPPSDSPLIGLKMQLSRNREVPKMPRVTAAERDGKCLISKS
jgi:hypothetical protein